MQYKNTNTDTSGSADLKRGGEPVSEPSNPEVPDNEKAAPATFWQRLWVLLKNRYVITFAIFLIIWLTASDNSYFTSRRLRKQVRELHRQEAQLRKNIETDSIQHVLLQHDPEAIERYGREHYYMRRSGEEVFVLPDAAK